MVTADTSLIPTCVCSVAWNLDGNNRQGCLTHLTALGYQEKVQWETMFWYMLYCCVTLTLNKVRPGDPVHVLAF